MFLKYRLENGGRAPKGHGCLVKSLIELLILTLILPFACPWTCLVSTMVGGVRIKRDWWLAKILRTVVSTWERKTSLNWKSLARDSNYVCATELNSWNNFLGASQQGPLERLCKKSGLFNRSKKDWALLVTSAWIRCVIVCVTWYVRMNSTVDWNHAV